MHSKNTHLSLHLLRATLIAAAALPWIAAAQGHASAGGGGDARDERSYIVRTCKPERRTIAQTLRKTGSLISPSIVAVSTRISARLATLELADGTRVEEGTRVVKGQPIATLESRDFEAQLSAAAAALKSAEVTLQDRQREKARAETLFKEGTSTEQERDFALADFERAGAAVEQARAQVELARINVDETVLVAPMDGVVTERYAEPGDLLAVGTKVVTITEVDTLRFQLSVPTTLYAQLDLNKTGLTLEMDAYRDEQVESVISRIFPEADSDTRTVKVEAQLDNREGRYMPGMYAVAELALNRRENVLVVPNEAVIRNVADNHVYKVVDGVARTVPVELGIRADEVVEILSGLSVEDDIVIVGQHRLADGARVTVDSGRK